MKKLLIFIPFCFSAVTFSFPQSITQTVRGTVREMNTEMPVAGATVILSDMDPIMGVFSDKNGEFRFEDVPVGRHDLQVSFVGYKTVKLSALELVSGKELILQVMLEENIIETKEIIVKGYAGKDKPINEMALVSARSFTIEETEKYAGSWGDPARMSLNFAGVMTANDQLNAIIIRGNSPSGLLWRLDGVPIPNPNHFGDMGSTSGPISILNNNTLSNSDFFSGAFPAQYGNAFAGVFDLTMRSGNNENREYMAQVGFNGFELGVEGPFSKKSRASYMANYRYSTLGVFDALGIDMGIGAVPFYQDISFKLDFPGTKLGRLSLFGLGGKNHITFEDDKETDETEYTKYTSQMGVLGISHLIYVSKNSRFKTTVAGNYHGNKTISRIYESSVLSDWYGDDFHESKIFISEEFRSKISSRDNLLAGFSAEIIDMAYLDSIYLDDADIFVHHFDFNGNLILFQGFIQYQHKFSNKLSVVSGLHYQQITLNNKKAFEPRISLQWQVAPAHSLNLGYGSHSQMQARDVYYRDVLVDTIMGIYVQPNKELGFTKSRQVVLGYNGQLNSNLRLKAEFYYQDLYNIPVKQYPSSVAVINKDAGYYDMNLDSLVNKGTGRNMGVEITFERFFTGNYYYLATVSLFDSKYRGSDGILRNTAYNGNYVVNLLGGYEFKLPKQNALSVDAKFTWAGGMRAIPIDLEESIVEGETVYDYDNAFEKRNPDYYRLDLRISFKMNRPKYSQEWAVDITNLTNHKNRFFEQYNPDTGEVEDVSQMGFFPVVLWRIRF